MQSTASSVLQTSFLIIGGDSKLGGLKVVERKPDPQTALSLFSAHNRLTQKTVWPKLTPSVLLNDSGVAHISVVIQSQNSQKKATLWY